MKYILFLFVCVFFSNSTKAQKVTDIEFAYLVPPLEGEVDTFPVLVRSGRYSGALVDSRHVSENPKTKAKLLALIKKLKANGSEDINKCFIPRHCVTLYNGDAVVYRMLVCFECDGIRFSNENKTTKIKSVEYREKAMAELKALFTQFHFEEKGISR